jgi:hypothetical protein
MYVCVFVCASILIDICKHNKETTPLKKLWSQPIFRFTDLRLNHHLFLAPPPKKKRNSHISICRLQLEVGQSHLKIMGSLELERLGELKRYSCREFPEE